MREIGLYDNVEYWIGVNTDHSRDEVQSARVLALWKALNDAVFPTTIVTCSTLKFIPTAIFSKFSVSINISMYH